MNEKWEAEAAVQNGEAVDSLVIRFEESSEGDNDSGDWPAPLEYSL
jgi:hypothetical protein